MYASAFMGSVVISSVFLLFNITAIIWIVFNGLLMLAENAQGEAFNSWVIVSIMYVVILVAYIAWRLSSRSIIVMVDSSDSNRSKFMSMANSDHEYACWSCDGSSSRDITVYSGETVYDAAWRQRVLLSQTLHPTLFLRD